MIFTFYSFFKFVFSIVCCVNTSAGFPIMLRAATLLVQKNQCKNTIENTDLLPVIVKQRHCYFEVCISYFSLVCAYRALPLSLLQIQNTDFKIKVP